MMKQRYILSFAAASAFLVFAACNKDAATLASPESDIIAFDPVFHSESDQTKGEMVTGETYDYSKLGPFWVKVWNKSATEAQFGYTKVMQFTHSTGSGHTYWSTVDGSDKLKEYFWKKSGSEFEEKYFYAYTNLPASGATVTSSYWYAQSLQYNTYQIPDAKDQEDVLLGLGNGKGYAKTDYVGHFVKITFGHPLSAVKFKLGTIEGFDASAGDKIKEIKMVGVYSSGRYYNNDSGSNWNDLSSSTTVHMSKESGLPIGTGDIIGETFFLIPQNHATQNITIKVTLVSGGTLYTDIKATLSSDEWKAGNYYTYSLSTSQSSPLELGVTLADWGKIAKDIEIDSGSVQKFDGPGVDPWDNQDNGSVIYSD